MQDRQELSEIERECEAMLGRLEPARPRAAALELVVRAAREEGRSEAWRGVWMWRGVAAVLAVGLVVSVVWRTGGAADEPGDVVVEAPAVTVPVAVERAVVERERRSGPSQYLAMRKQMTEMDLEGLARMPLGEERDEERRPEAPATLRELWKMVENGAGS